MLTHLSLFTGIGGIDLASEWAGFTTVGQVEMADYPIKVLEKHWPNVPRWRDVRDVTAESFRGFTGLSTVDLISAGYPCQTFSLAGKRTGDLTLAREFIRVVHDLQPKWAVGENVYGHVSNGLDDVMWELEAENYETWAFVVPASAVGARHIRKRVFVVAYSHAKRLKECHVSAITTGKGQRDRADDSIVADASNKPDAQADTPVSSVGVGWNTRNDVSRCSWGGGREPAWAVPKSELGRMADGVSNGLDALGALGNAVVPQQVYPILKAIADIETSYAT